MKAYYVTCRVECERDFPPAFIRRILTDQAFFRVKDLRIAETPPPFDLKKSLKATYTAYIHCRRAHDTVGMEQARRDYEVLEDVARRQYGWSKKELQDVRDEVIQKESAT